MALPGVDQTTALAVAERIRSRTESTLISLAPGITDRISVSIGIASAPQQAHDRISLLRLADEALYRAKQAGRNRVVSASVSAESEGPGVEATDTVAPASRRSRRATTSGTPESGSGQRSA